MADYREQYPKILAAASILVAVSVDAPEASEAVRTQLSLPFPILCDMERRVVRRLHIYNPREKGGIAEPAVFIIDQDRVVRFVAVDTLIKRVPAAQIVSLLQAPAERLPIRRRVLFPMLSDWLSAIRNMMRR